MKALSSVEQKKLLKAILGGERTVDDALTDTGLSRADLVALVDAFDVEKKQVFERYQGLLGKYGALAAAAEGLVVTIPRGTPSGMKWRLRSQYPPHFASGDWDLSFQKTLANLLGDGEVFYDVGANAGFYALVGARLVGPRGRVICFEPLAPNCDAIRDVLQLNALSQCEVVEAAVADRDGQLEFFQHLDNGLGSLVALQPSAALQKVSVRALSLDSYARGDGRPPRAIKVDVEGAEDAVLAGAAALLREHKPGLLVELHSPKSGEAVLSTLRVHGYQWAPLMEEAGKAGVGPKLDLAALSPSNVAHIVALWREDVRLAALRGGFGKNLQWAA